MSTGPRTETRDGNPDAEVAILKTVKGTVIKILSAHSIAHPGNVWFTLTGTKGSIETPRGSAEKPVVYVEGKGEPHRWRSVEWDEISEPVPEEAKKAGHGGGDYFLGDGFIRAILEGRDTPINAYRAADYTVPGIMAARSAENGGIVLPLPDLRPEARKELRVRPPSLVQLEAAREPRHPARTRRRST